MAQDKTPQAENLGPGGLGSRLGAPETNLHVAKSSSLSSGRVVAVVLVAVVLMAVVPVVFWFTLGVLGLAAFVALLAAVGGLFGYRRYQAAQKIKQDEDAEVGQARRKHIVDLRNRRPRSVAILVANDSGDGSKTTTTANLSLTFRKCLKAIPVIVVEGRKDSAQGAHKHGLVRDEVTTIREFHQMIVDKKLHNADSSLSTELIFAALTATEGGIFFLQADPVTPVPDPFSASTGPSELVMQALMTTGAIILVDSGNASTEYVTLGMANKCTLGVFPTLLTAKSLTMWRDTVNNLRSHHATSPLMRDCVTVLSAVKSQRSLEKALKRMGSLPGDEGLSFDVKYDPHMADDVTSEDDNNGTKVADLDKILPENRDVFEQIAETLLEKFVRQGVNQTPAVTRLPERAEQS